MKNKRAFDIIMGIALNVFLAVFVALFIRLYMRLQSMGITANDKLTRDAEILRVVCYMFLPWVGLGCLTSAFLFWRLRRSE